jgi:quercetin dioxygenase-like cupin family protein
MSQTTVTPDEVRRRTILRSDWVPCKAAFIDCRTPGSDLKDNYSFIGSGVSQSAQQFVNLTEPHGFSLGAAGMPRGTTNSLHMHFTAEVFINFGGEYRLRWGADGRQGEYVSTDGDVISVPTWVFRGFTNEGPDDGILLTVLGRDDTGGIIWGPLVLEEAKGYGLRLTADNRLVDTAAGEKVPSDVDLISPMPQEEIDRLDRFTPEEFRTRVITPSDRRWVERPFLCSGLPKGNAQLAPLIGYGMTENRRVVPPIHEPHNFNLAWLRATSGEGMLRHRHQATQVVTAKSGRWVVCLNDGDAETVELGPLDTLSVPPGVWRSFEMVDPTPGDSATPGWGELLVVNGCDGRVELEWDGAVTAAARRAGSIVDANGYVAPTSVLNTATEDD